MTPNHQNSHIAGQTAHVSSRSDGRETPARQIRLASGVVSHSDQFAEAQRGDWLCLSTGAPVFPGDKPADRAEASQRWLELFEQHGPSCAARVKGRFGVVFFHCTRDEVVLVTDRFATYPWVWQCQDGGFAFSDRTDQLPGTPDIDLDAIYSYLFFHVIPSPLTVLKGVERLEPACALHFTSGTVECSRYWRPRFDEQPVRDRNAEKQRFLDIIENAVARDAVGAQTGTFLSGGTDSSTVTGMLCRIQGRPARAFSIGFDADGYDEMEYARIAATHFGADHKAYYVTPDDLVTAIPLVATHYDQPFGNSSAVPAWICAARAREDGIERLLAGDGGDELFGGNTRYAKQKVFGAYDAIPSALRQRLIEPMCRALPLDRIPVIKKGASYVEQASVPMPDRLQMYNMLIRLGHDNVFERAFLDRADMQRPYELQRDVWQQSEGASLVNRMLAFDWKFTLADNDLPKVVGTTGLAGLEVAFPLLDDDLMDLSLHLPTDEKLHGLKLRWFFKEALTGFLPDAILTKKKHGFGLPFGVWATSHAGLKSLANDALGSFAARGVVRSDFIRDLIERWLPAYPGYYGEMVWIIMMLEHWLRANRPDWKAQ